MDHLATVVIAAMYIATECNGFQTTSTTPLPTGAFEAGPSPRNPQVPSSVASSQTNPASPVPASPLNNGPSSTVPSQNLTSQTVQTANQASQIYPQQNMQQQYQMNLFRSQMYPRESMFRGSSPLSHMSLPALSPPSSPLLPFTSSFPTGPSQSSTTPYPLTMFLQMVTFISRIQAAKDLKCQTIPELLGMEVPVYFPMSCSKCPPGRVCRNVGSVGFCCPFMVTDRIIAFRGLMGTSEAMKTTLGSQ